MSPAIECERLEKTYRLGFFARRVRALRGIDLRVDAGEVLGLIGPNGAGKSTTIKILLDLVLPTAGLARLFGLDVRDPRSRTGVGYLPEAPAPPEYLTAEEYLDLQGRLAGLRGPQLAKEIDRVLERVEMGAHRTLQLRRYSKGMLQRVILAGALLGGPRLLVLDEPTSGLDPIGRRLVRDVILEQRKAGVAVLFCTHILSDVESLCDRVALLAEGTIRREGEIGSLVSSDATTHEIVLEGLDEGSARTLLGADAAAVQMVARRVIVLVREDRLQASLRAILEHGGRVLRLQPAHLSLEETFFETVKGLPQRVGGAIE